MAKTLNGEIDYVQEIKDAWGWVGIEPIEILYINRFGNLIIRDERDRFWRLCPEDSYCEIVAANPAELEHLKEDKEFMIDWAMGALVDLAEQSVGKLAEGQCYCLALPSVVGGTYDVANLASAPLHELIRSSGSLAEQIKDLPDGAAIKIKITD